MYIGRGFIYLMVGIALVFWNIFPAIGEKLYTDPFWGRIAGIGFILVFISQMIFPNLYYVPVIILAISIIILLFAFIKGATLGRVQ